MSTASLLPARKDPARGEKRRERRREKYAHAATKRGGDLEDRSKNSLSKETHVTETAPVLAERRGVEEADKAVLEKDIEQDI